MKIIPKKGYILVSDQNIDQDEERAGKIILTLEKKKKTYLRVESEGQTYKKGECVFAQPFKTKMQIEDNLYLIAEEDIVASFTL